METLTGNATCLGTVCEDEGALDVAVTILGAARGKGRGFTGGVSKTVGREVKVGPQRVRVDVEFPTGGSSNNVPVQTKGLRGPTKTYINDAQKLEQLLRSIRENPEVVKNINRAFDLLNRFQP